MLERWIRKGNHGQGHRLNYEEIEPKTKKLGPFEVEQFQISEKHGPPFESEIDFMTAHSWHVNGLRQIFVYFIRIRTLKMQKF